MARQREAQLAYSELMDKMLDEDHRRQKARKISQVLLHFLGRTDFTDLVVVDVGCSAGYIADSVAEQGGRTFGIDIDVPGLAKAHARFGERVGFLCADGEQLPFADASVDVVVFNHIYEHVVDPVAVLRDIKRVLKPEGAVYLGLGNRLGIMEPHYRLPFLSYLTPALADRYVRAFGRADSYYERFRTRPGLRKLVHGLKVWDYSVVDPGRAGPVRRRGHGPAEAAQGAGRGLAGRDAAAAHLHLGRQSRVGGAEGRRAGRAADAGRHPRRVSPAVAGSRPILHDPRGMTSGCRGLGSSGRCNFDAERSWDASMGIYGRTAFKAEQARFWVLRTEGMRTAEISAAIGVPEGTLRRWAAERGGVAPRPTAPPSGRFLSAEERDKIAVLAAGGATRAAIARELGRHRSTIGRELERNSDRLHPPRISRVYYAGTAQKRAEERRKRPKPAKLRRELNPELHDHVQAMLRARWSPEQISKCLPEAFPDRPEMRVSHETIYQALYVQGRGALRRELAACLRTGRAIRRPKKRSDERRGRIPNMVMISERPAEVEDRAVPGHWEGDLIVGKDSGSAIGTLVERSTRYVMLLHLPERHGALEIEQAMLDAVGQMPTDLRKTLTWDQGIEMSNHASIALATGLEIYFCDPHSPWQRGSNENTNGLLRQYFPKGTDLRVHTAQDLRDVAEQLNGRPRKTLGWKSPHEALNRLLVATTA